MAAGKHLILATIIDVHPGQVTYPACITCYTKLHHLSTSNKFQCQRCGRLYEVSEVHHRYRLAVKVTSQSVCREVTVFGSCLDPFFGMDATAFARYTQHAAQYHQTAWNELDILHASVTNTLVGHPFYFGFKTAGNLSAQKGSHTASCVSLANIAGRDSEGLVAVQMTSPFQKWNFPTVVQNLFRRISNRKGRLMEKGEYVQCSSKDGCEICSLMAIPQNQTEEKVNRGHEAIDHPEKEGIDTQEILDLTSSRRDTTCDESCRTTSTLGETFFSCSIPSFRLSCDKTLTTINRTLHNRLSSDSISAEDHAGYFQYVGNKEFNLLHMGDNIVGHQESHIHESRSVKETFSHTGKACADVTLQEFVTKDELTEGSCQKKAPMSGSCVNIVNGACDENIVHGLRGHTCIEENPVDTSDTYSKNSCKGMTSASRTSDHEQDATATNDSSIIQECEQFMNQWLEENSFDQWSHYGSIPDPGESHRDSPSHDNKAVRIGTHCREEDREECEANRSCHPELSHSSPCPEFPDDLPFSEDLDQFLHGMEEECAETREKEVRAHSHHSRIHQVKDESARTDGCEKEITTISKADKSIRLEGESVSIVASGSEVSCHYERTDKDKNLCTCDDAQSCGNHKLEERCLIKSSSSASGSFKGETEANLCNAKERECEGIMMPDFKCNTFQEDGKEQQSIPQSCRDELTDWNATKGKQLDDYICDDEGDGSVYSEILMQDEQVQSTSVWCEDYSQSPLLFSQSQSPILPVRPSRYLMTSQPPRSQILERSCSNDANNSLPIQHESTPPSRLGSNHRGEKLNRKADAPIDQVRKRSHSENLHKEIQAPDRRADASKDKAHQMSEGKSSPEDLQILGKGTPDSKADTPKERAHQRSDIENSPVDLQSPDQGTPCLFSQASHDSRIPSHFSNIPRNSRRTFHDKQKATPLRQLFLQRARFWKMSSTPMTSKKNITKVERSFESPSSCGTPSLFSTESSPGVDDSSWNYDQGKHSKESFKKEVSGSLECTPDLF